MSERAEVGYQGLPGAYSEMAVESYFAQRSFRAEPFSSFEDVFEALVSDTISDAVLPFENSVAGMVHANWDLLGRYPVRVCGEQVQSVRHCLLLPPGEKADGIEKVISHPQALAQCGDYLRLKGIEAIPFFDTAGAAAHLARERTPGMAAIASARAAAIYGLEVVAQDLVDGDENLTRFLHLRKESAAPSEPGSGPLRSLLLVSGALNLTRLTQAIAASGLELFLCEARPERKSAWRYLYFLEIEGSPALPAWKELIMRLQTGGQQFKLLGSYGTARSVQG